MTRREIEEKIVQIVSEELHVPREKVTMEASFINDLGADSLDTVELVMRFEDAFDLKIPDTEMEKIQTVGDAVRYVCESKGAS
jgi:acyl carrier protein